MRSLSALEADVDSEPGPQIDARGPSGDGRIVVGRPEAHAHDVHQKYSEERASAHEIERFKPL
jgi:hypothetical protein